MTLFTQIGWTRIFKKLVPSVLSIYGPLLSSKKSGKAEQPIENRNKDRKDFLGLLLHTFPKNTVLTTTRTFIKASYAITIFQIFNKKSWEKLFVNSKQWAQLMIKIRMDRRNSFSEFVTNISKFETLMWDTHISRLTQIILQKIIYQS